MHIVFRTLARRTTGLWIVLVSAGLILTPWALPAQSMETILDLENSDLGGFSLLIDPASISPAPSRLWLGGLLNGKGTLLAFDQAAGTNAEAAVRVYSKIGYDAFSGDLYVGGGAVSGGQTGWSVLRSRDNGVTWSQSDWVATGSIASSGGLAGFAADGAGAVYAAGLGRIRKTVDHGNTWATIHQDATFSASEITWCQHGLFAVGTSSTGRWTVTRSRNGGTNWIAADSGPDGFTTSIVVDTSGVIYAGGRNTHEGTWLVRRSSDGGNTWETVYSPVFDGQIAAMAIGPGGELYVAGIMYFQGPVWGIQKISQDGTLTDLETGDFRVGQLAIDRAGNLLAAGCVFTPLASTTRWILKRQRLYETPPLTLSRNGSTLVLRWPAWYATNSIVETTSSLSGSSEWSPVTIAPGFEREDKTITLEMNESSRFFRLRGP